MENALWIWENSSPKPDEYAEFYTEFTAIGGKAFISISADSNYAVYLNGEFIYSGQYPDYPHYKIHDKIDLSEHIKSGINKLGIIVWYYGIANYSYCEGKAGLKFIVSDESGILAKSDTSTLSRLSPAFENHKCKNITFQLGFSFSYDAKVQDNWLSGGGSGFHPSVISENNSTTVIRPCAAPVISKKHYSEFVKQNGNNYIYDLGKEMSGLLGFEIFSETEQKVLICYGEHLDDGEVRRIIGNRDFSAEFNTAIGENIFFNPFRRFGCRYIELRAEAPLTVKGIYIKERLNPVTLKNDIKIDTPLRQKIYDTSVRTLMLCMSDHYEDCPWREQGLYAMDSRNQMLFGYHTFEGYDFMKANLLLMLNDKRSDGLLSVVFPYGKEDVTIPSFSLHFISAMAEYLKYSKDCEFLVTAYGRLKDLLSRFIARMENELLPDFKEKGYWNFYEWIDGLDDNDYWEAPEEKRESKNSLILNCLLINAIESFNEIAREINLPPAYEELPNQIRNRINEVFFDNESGLYNSIDTDKHLSELGNALAVICGAADNSTSQKIADELKKDNSLLKKCTLSMSCFKYDALLKTDKNNIDFILLDIDRNYGYMLNQGATSFWETILGEKDFYNAGSLCHGWSAIPVYYYSVAQKLGKKI